jgi:hypothetical protein
MCVTASVPRIWQHGNHRATRQVKINIVISQTRNQQPSSSRGCLRAAASRMRYEQSNCNCRPATPPKVNQAGTGKRCSIANAVV